MVTAEELASVWFFQGLPAWAIRRLAESASIKTYDGDAYLVHQHDEALAVFFLLEGTIQFLLRFEGVNDLLVGVDSRRGSLVGWSVFRLPYRHTASVRCEQPCRVLRLPADALREVIHRDPRLGLTLTRRVAMSIADRLEMTRDFLFDQGGSTLSDDHRPVRTLG
ncbi:DNA-binding transcriptional dual regulator Crp [Planctomycetes bacterium Pan216]|uniref:DNA-binding transcriptional dual regulator Crp n=1 Tax=Kolteria novifilia TaxID=2527975 RepID=A0A518B470_9BACT|nr:DNA-binding transcriptional dual regulator Crp [Planctomycetes bacterium Pan216]